MRQPRTLLRVLPSPCALPPRRRDHAHRPHTSDIDAHIRPARRTDGRSAASHPSLAHPSVVLVWFLLERQKAPVGDRTIPFFSVCFRFAHLLDVRGGRVLLRVAVVRGGVAVGLSPFAILLLTASAASAPAASTVRHASRRALDVRAVGAGDVDGFRAVVVALLDVKLDGFLLSVRGERDGVWGWVGSRAEAGFFRAGRSKTRAPRRSPANPGARDGFGGAGRRAGCGEARARRGVDIEPMGARAAGRDGRKAPRPARARGRATPKSARIVTLTGSRENATMDAACAGRTSRRLRKPSEWMAVWWTKISSEPSSGVMNPKPFWVLNHFTCGASASPGRRESRRSVTRRPLGLDPDVISREATRLVSRRASSRANAHLASQFGHRDILAVVLADR